jgi:hypothetical protein
MRKRRPKLADGRSIAGHPAIAARTPPLERSGNRSHEVTIERTSTNGNAHRQPERLTSDRTVVGDRSNVPGR